MPGPTCANGSRRRGQQQRRWPQTTCAGRNVLLDCLVGAGEPDAGYRTGADRSGGKRPSPPWPLTDEAAFAGEGGWATAGALPPIPFRQVQGFVEASQVKLYGVPGCMQGPTAWETDIPRSAVRRIERKPGETLRTTPVRQQKPSCNNGMTALSRCLTP